MKIISGGTALAARLAGHSFRVKVYEKNAYSGGRLSLIHSNGHRFDQGPLVKRFILKRNFFFL